MKTLQETKDGYVSQFSCENFEDYLCKIADSEDGVKILGETFDEVVKLHLKNKIEELFQCVKHGDKEHQDWLKNRFDSFLEDNRYF